MVNIQFASDLHLEFPRNRGHLIENPLVPEANLMLLLSDISTLNQIEEFATEMSDKIFKHQVDHWLFGHHHQNHPSFQLGSTWLHTNQFGYLAYHEHKGFQRDRTLEITVSNHNVL